MKTKMLLIVLLSCICPMLLAQENFKETSVVARGTGETVDDATKDALSQAVQQVVGTMVDTETIVQNEEVINDKVLTYANGMVSHYDVIKPAVKQKNGLYSIAIKAIVQQKKVHEKLVSAEVIKVKVTNTVNLKAQMELLNKQKQELKVSMEQNINEFFNLLQPDKLMIPTFVDTQGRVGKDAKLSVTAIPGNSEEVEMSMGIVVEFDTDYYTKTLLPQLLKLLEQIADKEGDIVLYPRNASNETEEVSLFNGAWKKKRYIHRGGKDLNTKQSEAYIMVNVARRYNNKQNPFQEYKFKNTDLFRKVLRETIDKWRNIHLCISFLDSDNNEIEDFYIRFRYDAGFQTYKLGLSTSYRYGAWEHLAIAPWFGWSEKPFVVGELRARIKLEDLKDVGAMKISFKYIDVETKFSLE